MLAKMADQLQRVTKSPVEVEPELVENERIGGIVTAPKDDVQVELAWDHGRHYITAHIETPEELAASILGMCNTLGDSMDSGSILLPEHDLEVDFPQFGYAKQFVYPLRRQVPTGVRYWLVDEKTEQIRQSMEQLLGIPVEMRNPSADERPFIYTIDWQGSWNGEPFACYFHLHSLSLRCTVVGNFKKRDALTTGFFGPKV